jgi:hypothetical protein
MMVLFERCPPLVVVLCGLSEEADFLLMAACFGILYCYCSKKMLPALVWFIQNFLGTAQITITAQMFSLNYKGRYAAAMSLID